MKATGKFLLVASAFYMASWPALVLLYGSIQALHGNVTYVQPTDTIGKIAIIVGVSLGIWFLYKEYSLKPLWAFTSVLWVVFLLLMYSSSVVGLTSILPPFGIALYALLLGASVYLCSYTLVYQQAYRNFQNILSG